MSAETKVKTRSITLTESDLRRMWPNGKSLYIKALLEKQDVLAKYGILDNAERWCMAAGNFDAETGGLHVVAENMSYSAKRMREVWPSRFRGATGWAKARRLAHNPRRLANAVYNGRMGNRRGTDDGYNYRGKTLLQITGREMYVDLGERLNVPLSEQPESALDSAVMMGIVGETWTARTVDLNKLADQGHFRKVCNAINRGSPNSRYNPIGWSHRQQGLRKARKIWGNAAPEVPGTLREGDTGYAVGKLQERLIELGYVSVGAVDRDFGDNTAGALANFQRINGLVPDSIFGPVTRAAIESDDAMVKPHNAERIDATVKDLRAAGSTTLAATGQGKVAVAAISSSGALGVLSEISEQLESVKAVIDPLKQNIGWLASYWPVGALVVAFLIWQQFDKVEKSRVSDHATGKNTGR